MMKRLLAGLSFFVPLGVYVRTLCPTVGFGDSGELITAAVSLGIPHPPGFPLWVILSHLFTYIPINSPAWRVNFSSAVFAALTVSLLFIFVSEVLKRLVGETSKTLWIAFITALSFGFMRELWSQGVEAEVYMLYSFLSVFLLYCLFRFQEKENPKWLFLSFFTVGLSIATHYLAFLYLPFLSIYLLICHRRAIFIPKTLVLSLLALVVPLTLFLYLPVRSSANPVIDWGNPENLANFLAVIRREQFTRVYKSSVAGINIPLAIEGPQVSFVNLISQAVVYVAQGIWFNLSVLGLLLIIPGLYLLARKERRLFLLLTLSWLITGLGFSFLGGAKPSLEQEYIPILSSFLALAPLVGLGAFVLIDYLGQRLRGNLMVPLAVFSLLPVFFLLLNFAKLDQHKNTVAYDHAVNILKTVEPNALIFAEENEWLFPLLYVHKVEGVRPDIQLYDRNGNLFDDIYAELKKDYRSENYYEARRKVLEKNLAATTKRPAYYAVDKSFENYHYDDISNEGILYRLGEARPVDFGQEYGNVLQRELFSFRWGTGTAYILAYYHIQYGDYLKSKGEKDQALAEYEKAHRFGVYDTRILNNLAILFASLDREDRAEEVLRESLELKSDSPVAYNNLGTMMEKKGFLTEAEKAYMDALTADNKYLPAIVNLATLYEKQGKWEQALGGFKQAVALNPADRSLANKVTLLQGAIEKGGTYEKDFAEALKLAKEGKCQEALPEFERLFSQRPTNAKILNNVGVCYAQLGELEKARMTWEKVLEMEPENANAKENLSLLEGK